MASGGDCLCVPSSSGLTILLTGISDLLIIPTLGSWGHPYGFGMPVQDHCEGVSDPCCLNC
jgi:hypothetical protein